VSKHIASFEATIGTQLFARTTRKLRPTDEALNLYPHVRQFVDALEAAMPSKHDQPKERASGLLRVSMPVSFGRKCVVPLLPEFLGEHPQVSLDVQFNDQLVDLVEEGFELRIHIGQLPASTLVARPLGSEQYKVVAAPTYVKKYGRPDVPHELSGHNCVCYTRANSRRWEFDSEHGRQVVDVPGLINMNDSDAIYDFVRSGMGVALLPQWLVNDDIRAGRVEWLLDDYYPAPQPINFIYPQTRFLSFRARCFIDCLLRLTKAQNGRDS
jgi:DNA-binding transcriptional LysR family regulator